MSGPIADCDEERAAAVLAALGPARLAGLVVHFRDDLAALTAAADGLEPPALQQWAHRLHGSGSTLGFDAAAAALAGVAEQPGTVAPPAVKTALAEAAAALARGERRLAAAVPVLAAALQEAGASKR